MNKFGPALPFTARAFAWGRWSRRSLIGGLLTSPLIASADHKVSGLQAQNTSTLGAAIRSKRLETDLDYRAAIVRECGRVTPEVELKWAYVEPVQGVLQMTDVDAVASFAAAHGLRMHGHTLLWHKSIPEWANEGMKQRNWQPVRSFFASVIPRYADICDSWDVINEPIETGYRMDGLRPSPFLQAFGPNYIRLALEEARSLAPQATLLVNEYGLEHDVPIEKDRRYLFLKMVEGLKKAGVPLDAIGLQSHLHLSLQHRFDPKIFATFLSELKALGVQLWITELDIQEADTALPVEKRDRLVADAAARYLDVVTEFRPTQVTCWGLSDRYSWLGSEDPTETPPGQAGLNRGLPLDASFRAKPLYNVIARFLRTISE